MATQNTNVNAATTYPGAGGRVCVADAGDTSVLVARITSWSVNPIVATSAWRDSDSRGYTCRQRGGRDCTGSISGMIDSDYPQYGDDDNQMLMADGDVVSLEMWMDGDQNTPSKLWYFPRAIISNFNLSIDVNAQENPVEFSADFEADGVFYKPGEARLTPAPMPDHTIPTTIKTSTIWT